MPGSVTSINVRRPGKYVLLEAALPGRPSRNIGVLLIDPAADRAFLRVRPGFDDIADPLDAEVFAALEDHIRDCIGEMGAEALLQSLEDTASNAIRVSDRADRGGRCLLPRAGPALLRSRRNGPGAAVPHARAAVQPARGGRRAGRGDGVGSRGLGAGARRHAALRRTCSSATWWAARWSRAFPTAA